MTENKQQTKPNPPSFPSTSSDLHFYLNGKPIYEKNVQPAQDLLSYLRGKELTGTKYGCGEGGCGACTIIIQKYYKNSNKVETFTVNSCIYPLANVAFCHVITIEYLSSPTFHTSLQHRLSVGNSTQCGYCTSGFIMTLYGLFSSNPNCSVNDIEEVLDGNLCRCTGYRSILDASQSLCHPAKRNILHDNKQKEIKDDKLHSSCSCDRPYSQDSFTDSNKLEIIFPEALKKNPTSLFFIDDNIKWVIPSSFQELLSWKFSNPSSIIVAGNTEVCFFPSDSLRLSTSFLHGSTDIPFTLSHTDDHLMIPFYTTITQLQHYMDNLINNGFQKGKYILNTLSLLFKQFASHHVRNVATLVGGLVNASPISDICAPLMAMKANLFISSPSTISVMVLDPSFFKKYKVTNIDKSSIISAISIPWEKDQYSFIKTYKCSRRQTDDISIIISCFNLSLSLMENEKDFKIDSIIISIGGIAPIPSRIVNAENFFSGKIWNKDTIDLGLNIILDELKFNERTPGGMMYFRPAIVLSHLFHFFCFVSNELHSIGFDHLIDEKHYDCLEPLPHPIHHSLLSYPIHKLGESNVTYKNVYHPFVHESSIDHVKGTAEYTDDITVPSSCLYGYLVCSERSHAEIKSISFEKCNELQGFVGFYGGKDVPGSNVIGDVIQDEPVFPTSTVTYYGQPIGIVVATTYSQAKKAASLIKVTYENLPAIYTIDEAIEANSFQGNTLIIENGNVTSALKEAEITLSGNMKVGGQEHFCLETQSTLVIPATNRQTFTLFSTTQNPSAVQHFVGTVLNIPSHRITVKVKRLGGAFGGKETRNINIACYAVVPSYHLGLPIKLTLERGMDMMISGQRHPFLGKYQVGFTKKGELKALDLQLFSNGGFSLDLSEAILARGVFFSDSCYKWPNFRVTGRICKTNLPSNTAFRGFGGPQGYMITENIMEHIASYLSFSPHQLRYNNLYRSGDSTHYHATLDNFQLKRIIDELYSISEFEKREKEVIAFNNDHFFKKKGISIIPMKFGISFTAKFLNQGSCLIHIYHDGSVLLSVGGVEMGQGLYTKMKQIAAEELGISIEYIHIEETSTDKVANTPPTAASTGTDLNGMAIVNACSQIMKRLEPLKKENPSDNWSEICNKAYFNRISLSASGFYCTPDVGYDFKTQTGNPFAYYTLGASVSEVEIDILSGQHVVLRSDILMDIGKSINPHIDIGQIEGAFIQGVGLFTMEELVRGDDQHKWVFGGSLQTAGPGYYKIPGIYDIPRDFRVHLFNNSSNKLAVYSSKGIGEPPLLLASSVFFAIKNAIDSYRKTKGLTQYYPLYPPLTIEKIRMACYDDIVKSVVKDPSYQPIGSY